MIFYHNCVVTSDSEGNLIFYSNGKSIATSDHQTMENGEGLNPGDLASDSGTNYVNAPQSIISLPAPGTPNRYHLLHAPFNFFSEIGDFVSFGLLQTTVDMEANNGLGSVITKNEAVLSDTTLWLGKLTATKHANGRDWWVLYNKWETNIYYKILLSPQNIEVVDTQAIGTPVIDGLGQAVFSPDGSKFVVVNSVFDEFLQIFDFDRCTGELSNEVYIQFAEYHETTSPGVAVSANSRFLYYSATDTLYQFDLWANDIPSSSEVVGIYDGNIDPFSNAFYLAQLAPDGKIYICVPNGSNYLHVIEKPNAKGLASNFQQRAIDLMNRNGFSLPNNPNYRLGPLDGSPCDTLGLDNMPVAKFRYEQDSMDYLQVEFTDLSYYEPADWHWDFDDNMTSQDTSPVHVFQTDGVYKVCLTVTNVNGTDTRCQTLQLGTVTAEEKIPKVGITVFPNPAREGVNVILPNGYLPKAGKITLFDSVGKLQLEEKVLGGWNSLQLDGLPPGIYFYEVRDGGVLLDSGRLVKVE